VLASHQAAWHLASHPPGYPLPEAVRQQQFLRVALKLERALGPGLEQRLQHLDQQSRRAARQGQQQGLG
jgi:hypothetical protein